MTKSWNELIGDISASQTADVEVYPGDQANTGSILNRSNNDCFAKPHIYVSGLRQVEFKCISIAY